MAAVTILPKDVPRVTESQGVKLFGKWDAEYARLVDWSAGHNADYMDE